MADYQDEASKSKQIVTKLILIVEDDTAFGTFLCNAIEQETPYQALCVRDSLQALDVVKEVTPDLIILDYHLPTMNGIELYDRLHAIDGIEHVPTIMTTAGVLEHDLQGRHIVGMSKPVGLNKLLDIVTELMD